MSTTLVVKPLWWPLSSLPSRSFVRCLIQSEDIAVGCGEGGYALQQQTIFELCVVVFGNFQCCACSIDGRALCGSLEGHHTYGREMHMSSYRHCKTGKFRLQAMH